MDDKSVCPYNNAHVVSKLRFPYHITKCKKNYTNVPKIICPYDATEYVDPKEYHRHLATCTRKNTFDVHKTAVIIKSLKSYGDCTPRTYEVDPAMVSNDWDTDVEEQEPVIDELKVTERITRTSMLIKRACSYIPEVKGLGRGEKLLISCMNQTSTNGSYSNHLKVNGRHSYNNGKSLMNDYCDDDDGAYDDAVDNDFEVERGTTPLENRSYKNSDKTNNFRASINDSRSTSKLSLVNSNTSLQNSEKLSRSENLLFAKDKIHSNEDIVSSTDKENTVEINSKQNTILNNLPNENRNCVQNAPCSNKTICKQENNSICSKDTLGEESVSENTSLLDSLFARINFKSPSSKPLHQTITTAQESAGNIRAYNLVDNLVNDLVSKYELYILAEK